jgi:hypothetical protein
MKAHNKKNKSVSAKQLDQQGLGVLLEQMDSKLDLVVESHESLDRKIDALEKNINQKFFEVDQKFGIVNERLDTVDERFDAVDERFTTVLEELHLIRNDLKEKVSREEFIILEKRVLTIEKKLTEKNH